MTTENRRFFVVSFVVEGRDQLLHIPAFVESIGIAEQKAIKWLETFPDSEEGKQMPDAKLSIQSIVVGGSILI